MGGNTHITVKILVFAKLYR